MKRAPSKIIWSSIPGTLCNLDCEYCYNRNKKRVKGQCNFSVAHMLKCFNPKRFGGPIFFNGTGGGETLLWDGIIDFTEGMLSYGHVVSYTTNMTLTPVLKKFVNFPKEYRLNLLFLASLHYLELKRRKLLDTFFENLRMLKSAGISYTILLCISDSCIPYLREISELCQKEIGILPIAAMLREYDSGGGKVVGKYPPDVEKLVEETCDTRYWMLQKRIFGHKRTEFCHAGEYSITLDLSTGNYTKCWGRSGPITGWEKLVKKMPFLENRITMKLFKKPNQIMGNIFENPDEPIKFEPIGLCPFYDCVCPSYLFWGCIPELDVETCSKTWLTKSACSDKLWDFLDSKQNE